MKFVILAGGSGTRLWPLSRKTFPKQFLKLNENKSLLQKTVERFLKVVSSEDIIIMTNRDYKFLVLAGLSIHLCKFYYSLSSNKITIWL